MTLAGSMMLVTGACGFVGGAVAMRLAAEGCRVRALVHTALGCVDFPHLTGVEVIPGDVTDAAQMRELAAGCAYVFHTVALWRGPWARQRAVNVAGTENIARAAAGAGVRRFVHVSTISVYGFRLAGVMTEDAPLAPGRTVYNATKAEAEGALRRIAGELGLSYSIIRPGNIYGPRSLAYTHGAFRLANVSLLGRRYVLWPGAGDGPAHCIHIDDVVDLMITLATHPAAHGQAFHCAPDPSPTWHEFLMAYARLGGRGRWLGLPTPLVRLAAGGAELWLNLSGQPAELRALLRYYQTPLTFSMAKARALLGWSPRVGLEEGVARCAPWLREQGLLA